MDPMPAGADPFFGDQDLPDDPVRVVLGDDNPLYRRGLLTTLEDEDDLEVVAEAEPGPDLVAAVRALGPDVVLCALTTGPVGGVETAFALTEVMPLVRVVVLTTESDAPETAVAAVRAGASGVVDKVDALEDAARVIRRIHDGWPVLPSEVWRSVAASAATWLGPGDQPTPAETAALQALSTKDGWDEVADVLGVPAEVARNQVRNVLARVRATGDAAAEDAAVRAGLVAAR